MGEREREMGVSEKLKLLVPYAAMVTVESLDVGLTTLSKAAMERGMSHFVFVFYSNVLATLLLFPLSLFLNRGKRQPITFSLLCKFFLLGLFGITLMQNCVFTGINFSSPTLGSAMAQLVPAFTFVLAVIFRMERLNLRSSKSQIKIVSTAITIAGALIVVLHKGPPIGGHIIKLHSEPADSFVYTENSWILGGLFLAAACLSLSIFFTFQAVVLKEFPSELTAVFFYFLFGSIQSFVLSLIAERDWNVWKLRPDIELVSIFYSAICGNLVTFLILAWCVHKKGPVFVAMFKPLSIAIAAFLGVIFLNNTLHVGSIGGAVVIVAGFYGVVWSQSKEEGEAIVNNTDTPSSSSSQKTPLLDNHLNV